MDIILSDNSHHFFRTFRVTVGRDVKRSPLFLLAYHSSHSRGAGKVFLRYADKRYIEVLLSYVKLNEVTNSELLAVR
jgi:hypothetical protein